MRALLLVALLPLGCRQAPEPGRPVKEARPPAAVRDAARFEPPPGWRPAESAVLGEPVAEFERAGALIRLQLFGGPGSRHADPAAFLSSREARDDAGGPPRLGETAAAAGARVPTYERELGAAAEPGSPPKRALRERFAVIPGRGRFLVVSLIMPADDTPEAREPAEAAWRDMLASLQITPL